MSRHMLYVLSAWRFTCCRRVRAFALVVAVGVEWLVVDDFAGLGEDGDRVAVVRGRWSGSDRARWGAAPSTGGRAVLGAAFEERARHQLAGHRARDARRGRHARVVVEPGGGLRVRAVGQRPVREIRLCFASMSFQQAHQYFSAVWADGFPRSRHHAVSDVR